jgi:hypothetical protein
MCVKSGSILMCLLRGCLRSITHNELSPLRTLFHAVYGSYEESEISYAETDKITQYVDVEDPFLAEISFGDLVDN